MDDYLSSLSIFNESTTTKVPLAPHLFENPLHAPTRGPLCQSMKKLRCEQYEVLWINRHFLLNIVEHV